MPTTRRPLARKRNASFTPEVLRLFLELENSPRRGKRFEADGRRLMQLLGLSEHWWTGNSVLNHDPVPYTTPNFIAWHDLFECRLVREQLLAACGGAVPERRDRASRQSAPPH